MAPQQGQTMIFVLLCQLAGLAFSSVRSPPLPTITQVSVDTTLSKSSAQVTVHYQAREEPHVTWFVDGFPIPENRLDFNIINFYETWGTTMLTLTRDKGSEFSVCLQTTDGKVCMQLQPLPEEQVELRNATDFPWPLLVPAPLARYDLRENAKVHAPQLPTVQANYSYQATLLSHNPFMPDAPLVRFTARDMEGGQARDPVTITPVTSSMGGWMVEVATAKEDYEGVLIISTTFRPQSHVVKSMTLSRPVTIYRRDHSAAFYPGFVAMVPRAGQALPWICRPGFDCLVTCPFVSNGDVTVTLSRMRGGGHYTDGEEPEEKGRVLRLGEYYGEALFVIKNFLALHDGGTYLCSANTDSKTVVASIVVA